MPQRNAPGSGTATTAPTAGPPLTAPGGSAPGRLANLDGVTVFHVPEMLSLVPEREPESIARLRHDLELLAGVER